MATGGAVVVVVTGARGEELAERVDCEGLSLPEVFSPGENLAAMIGLIALGLFHRYIHAWEVSSKVIP